MLTCSRGALQTCIGSVKDLLSTVLECQMHWTLQVIPAAVFNRPTSAASFAGSKNELDDISAVRLGRGPTCAGLASTDRQRPSLAALLADVSLHSSTIIIPPQSFPINLRVIWASHWEHRRLSQGWQSVVCVCKHIARHKERCSFACRSAHTTGSLALLTC